MNNMFTFAHEKGLEQGFEKNREQGIKIQYER